MKIPDLVPWNANTDTPLSQFPPKGHTSPWPKSNRWGQMSVWDVTTKASVPNNCIVDWRPNKPFMMAFVIEEVGSPRSSHGSPNIFLRSTDGKFIFRVHHDIFLAMMPRVSFIYGVITETWVFERRANELYLRPSFITTGPDVV